MVGSKNTGDAAMWSEAAMQDVPWTASHELFDWATKSVMVASDSRQAKASVVFRVGSLERPGNETAISTKMRAKQWLAGDGGSDSRLQSDSGWGHLYSRKQTPNSNVTTQPGDHGWVNRNRSRAMTGEWRAMA